ncbi:hypothetical protein [Candidatus Vidania fulgoroideorum]
MFFYDAFKLLLNKKFSFRESLDLSIVFYRSRKISFSNEILLPYSSSIKNVVIITTNPTLIDRFSNNPSCSIYSLKYNIKSKLLKSSDLIFLDAISYGSFLARYKFLSSKYFRNKVVILKTTLSEEYYISLILGKRLYINVNSSLPLNIKLGYIDMPLYQLSSNFNYIVKYISELFNNLGIKPALSRLYLTTTQGISIPITCNDI